MSAATSYKSPLGQGHRTVFFYLLLGLFIIIVPLLVFYAHGYRYNVWGDTPTLTITGGLYISTQVDDSLIFINDEPVQNTRFFRQATYVQGLAPGLHNIHIQGDGLQTWTKRLPVYQQIVTEVSAFTTPERPQVRPITPYRAVDGEVAFLGYAATSSLPFNFASSTISITYSASAATSTWEVNPEYTFLESQFADLVRPVYEQSAQPRFRFATTSEVANNATTTATSTVRQSNIRLERRDEDVYAVYEGTLRNIPYYFCVPTLSAASTTEHYGVHVSEVIHDQSGATTTAIQERGTWLGQMCRTDIRIDRMHQTVTWFDFVPGSNDLVLLQLHDGVYITEIDDRSWQNHQLLYPGEELTVLVEGGQIFVRDGAYFAEVFLTLDTN